MSYLLNITKRISKQFTGNSDFFTISTKDEKNHPTISGEEKGRLTKTKSVTFGDIEIVEVESYKKYNELDELSLEDKEIGCMKRCNIYCNCTIL